LLLLLFVVLLLEDICSGGVGIDSTDKTLWVDDDAGIAAVSPAIAADADADADAVPAVVAVVPAEEEDGVGICTCIGDGESGYNRVYMYNKRCSVLFISRRLGRVGLRTLRMFLFDKDEEE
jgi:hypothetical protein